MSKTDMFNMVVVGDSQTGKTALLRVLKDGERTSEQALPEFLQTFGHKMKVDSKKLELCLWDTSGKAEYEGLRRLAYPKCDVFLVCYSVDSRDSFENVTNHWLPEIDRHGPPGARVLIVGTKVDSRPRSSLIANGDDSEEKFVKYGEGMELANRVGASAFLECSILEVKRVRDVFEEASRAARRTLEEEKAKNKGRRGSGGIAAMLGGRKGSK